MYILILSLIFTCFNYQYNWGYMFCALILLDFLGFVSALIMAGVCVKLG